jgi:hypothetical protein
MQFWQLLYFIGILLKDTDDGRKSERNMSVEYQYMIKHILSVCVLVEPGVDRRIILKYIFRKWGVGLWKGSSWLRIGTGGGHL